MQGPIGSRSRSISSIIDFVRANHACEATIKTPTPAEFNKLLSHLAKADGLSLRDYQLPRSFLDEFIDLFSTQDLMEAFETCVRGVRKELKFASVQQEWNCCCFVDALQAVISDGTGKLNSQLRSLSRSDRDSFSVRLEQLATESEQKASSLTSEIDDDRSENIAVIMKILKSARLLREHTEILEQRGP